MDYRQCIERALCICENHGVKKIMNGMWEVQSTESDTKYEVISYINESGNLKHACACKAYQFSDKMFPEKTCKHCIAVAIFENGFIRKETVDYIMSLADTYDNVDMYFKVNTRNTYKDL